MRCFLFSSAATASLPCWMLMHFWFQHMCGAPHFSVQVFGNQKFQATCACIGHAFGTMEYLHEGSARVRTLQFSVFVFFGFSRMCWYGVHGVATNVQTYFSAPIWFRCRGDKPVSLEDSTSLRKKRVLACLGHLGPMLHLP